MVDPLIAAPGASAGDSSIRLVRAEDSFEALTDLLHRAYTPLAAMGFQYRATHQDVATARRRAAARLHGLEGVGARRSAPTNYRSVALSKAYHG